MHLQGFRSAEKPMVSTADVPLGGAIRTTKRLFSLASIILMLAWALAAPDAQAQKLGSEFRVSGPIDYDMGKQEAPSVAALADGGFIVVWAEFALLWEAFTIQAQVFDSAGQRIGGIFSVSDPSGCNSYNDCYAPSVAALDDGGFAIVYASQGLGGRGVRARIFSGPGAPVGAVHGMPGALTAERHIAGLKGGGFVYTWQGQGLYIYGQRYTAIGDPTGSSFLIGLQSGFNYISSDTRWHSVAGLSDGGFVAAWTHGVTWGSENLGIRFVRFNAVGQRVTGAVRVNRSGAGRQWGPAVSPVLSGGFVVMWTSDPQGGDYGQVYNAASTPVGRTEFPVFSYGSGGRSLSVSWLRDGGFVAATSFNDIRAQRFNGAGRPIGKAYKVNTTRRIALSEASVATIGEGRYVIVWLASDGTWSNPDNGIFGQIVQGP
jgi:hypothetical protein